MGGRCSTIIRITPHEGETIMEYTFSAKRERGYVHVVVEGDNTPANVRRYLSEVLNASQEYRCDRVIIEENLRGPSLSTLDIFDIVAKASEDPKTLRLKIAYIDLNREHDAGSLRFAETVAVNRVINVRKFSNLTEAERWLTSPDNS